jgi:hypothetical protein
MSFASPPTLIASVPSNETNQLCQRAVELVEEHKVTMRICHVVDLIIMGAHCDVLTAH